MSMENQPEATWLVGKEMAERSFDSSEATDPNVASRDDFIEFAAGRGINTINGIKAFRGLFRLYAEQQDPLSEVSHLPHLVLAPEPAETQRYADLLEVEEQIRVNVPSLQAFAEAVEDEFGRLPKKVQRDGYLRTTLPRMVGMSTVRIYSAFAGEWLDK
jgi:hypothetical protein